MFRYAVQLRDSRSGTDKQDKKDKEMTLFGSLA